MVSEGDGILGELNFDMWNRELADDEDREFLLDGIKHGFHITNVTKQMQGMEMTNYQSVLEKRAEVEKQIVAELQMGRYRVVQKRPKIVSALGAVPKLGKGVRLILDCSRPQGVSVNDYAELQHKITYQSVNEACQMLEKGDYMGKVDLKSAYRSVAIHPSNYEHMGLKWTFEGETHPTYMIDTRLAMGSRLAPMIFNRFSQSVCRMMKRRGFSIIGYRDD